MIIKLKKSKNTSKNKSVKKSLILLILLSLYYTSYVVNVTKLSMQEDLTATYTNISQSKININIHTSNSKVLCKNGEKSMDLNCPAPNYIKYSTVSYMSNKKVNSEKLLVVSTGSDTYHSSEIPI